MNHIAMLYYLSAQVMIGYDGKRRGFGFVSYEEPEAAEKVHSLILTVYFHCLDICSQQFLSVVLTSVVSVWNCAHWQRLVLHFLHSATHLQGAQLFTKW